MTQRPTDERPARFVAELNRLERGPRAQLRRGLGGDERSVYWLEGIYARTGYDRAQPYERAALQLLAGLYALQPKTDDDSDLTEDTSPEPPEKAAKANTIGRLMGRLYLAQDARPSTEKRFLALLDTDRDGLNHQLRQAVMLLSAGDLTPDWVRLTGDLLHWGDSVRRQWAQDFYQETAPKAPSRQDTADDDSTGDEPLTRTIDTDDTEEGI
ncbi:type I-E CRISPR-associated protein Cse2/CasB [Deinococcus sp. HMF7604]|uniref:type I-E CRISPR-associated protein Cse2/CasB n=1 Tax=Deinococcus betulae TaxID=2873312 RepID=UPI001CCB075A|nr:type I-E CRISPR-associated protein Cse2/CasB [Deinococcus betulae]MBZ9751896.1 type I-E CRISPR-associated protein Cse2/CasB [Deinococcus betulae]